MFHLRNCAAVVSSDITIQGLHPSAEHAIIIVVVIIINIIITGQAVKLQLNPTNPYINMIY